jgi:hypothetical protein
MRRLALLAVCALSACIDFDADFNTYCSVSGKCAASGGGSSGGTGGGSANTGGGAASNGGGTFGTGGGTFGTGGGGFTSLLDGGCMGEVCFIATSTVTSLNHAHLWAASSSDASSIWMVGTSSTDTGRVLHYNGSSWNEVSVSSTAGLRDIAGKTDTDLWVVGEAGDVLHYNGSMWAYSGTTSGSPKSRLMGIVITPQEWAAGDTSILQGASGTFTQVQELSGGAAQFDGIDTNGTLTVAVGEDIFANDTSLVYETTNGTTWNNIDVHLSQEIYAVRVLSGDEAFAAGDTTSILHRTSTGWTQEFPPGDTVFQALWGNSATDLWAGGWWGALYHRNMLSWQAYDCTLFGTPISVTDILGFDNGELWVVGDNEKDTVVLRLKRQ